MRDTYIKNLKAISNEEKASVNRVYSAALIASQQSFFESYQPGGKIEFDILEGTVTFDPVSETYTFNPSEDFKKLLSDSKRKETSVLLKRQLTRFAALLQEAFRDYGGKN